MFYLVSDRVRVSSSCSQVKLLEDEVERRGSFSDEDGTVETGGSLQSEESQRMRQDLEAWASV